MKRLLPLVAAAALGCGRGPAPDTPPPPSGETERLAAHPFWKARVTPADVEAMVDVIVAQRDNAVVVIDGGGKLRIAMDGDAQSRRLRARQLKTNREADIDMRRWDRKPTRAEALAGLGDELDQAAFRADPQAPHDLPPPGPNWPPAPVRQPRLPSTPDR